MLQISPDREELNRLRKQLDALWLSPEFSTKLYGTIVARMRELTDKAEIKSVTYAEAHPTWVNIRTCPHCGKHGSGFIMLRWHFGNCPKRPSDLTPDSDIAVTAPPVVEYASPISKRWDGAIGRTCPHCNTFGYGMFMVRKHFMNCKKRPS